MENLLQSSTGKSMQKREASFRKSGTGATSTHPAQLTGCTDLGCLLLYLGTDSTCLAANSLTIKKCPAEGWCYILLQRCFKSTTCWVKDISSE